MYVTYERAYIYFIKSSSFYHQVICKLFLNAIYIYMILQELSFDTIYFLFIEISDFINGMFGKFCLILDRDSYISIWA